MNDINLDNLTLGQIKDLRAALGVSVGGGGGGAAPEPHHYEVGKNYLIVTVTKIYTGRLVAVTTQELVLEGACWVADTGRFYDAMAKGFPSNAELEPYPEGKVLVGRGALVDASVWIHDLPREQR